MEWKKMVQTSFVKMCGFLKSFSRIQINRLCVGKSLIRGSFTAYQKPRSNKICILRILFLPEMQLTFQSRLFAFKKDSNYWNKRKRTDRTLWKAIFSFGPASIKTSQKINCKMQEMESKNESQSFITTKKFIT